MKKALTILLITFSFSTFAQQNQEGKDKISLPDSIVQQQKKLLSSIPLQSKTDSLSKKITTYSDSLKKISNSMAHIDDSLRPDYKKFIHGLDSVKGKLNHRIDSLTKLGLPHQQYTKTLDSLNKLNPAKEFQKIQFKINARQVQIASKISQPVKAVNDKINQLSKQTQVQGGALPSITVPKVNTISARLPSANLNTNTLSKDPLSQEVSTLQKNIANDLDPHLQNDLKNIAPTNEMKEVHQASSEVNKDISTYSSDAKNIAKGNFDDVKKLDKDIVDQLPNSEMGALQKEMQTANSQMAALKNKEEFKKQTLARGRKMALEQFAAQSKQIQPLITKINQYQKTSDDLIRQMKGLPKQRPPREGVPPFIERFIPGMVWQIQKNNLWRIDINPSIRFRVKKLISVGSGWNERIMIDQGGKFRQQERIYGIRNFVEVTIRKGFAARLDAEHMNAFVPISFQQQDVGERKWVWSFFAGIKKDFSFGRGVMGNVQLMYILHDPKNESPYLTKLNARFGFEFPIKVKRKKQL